MKMIYLMVLFVVSTAGLSAQTAKEYLDNVKAKYGANSTYYIKFDYAIQEGYGKENTYTGEFYSAKNKFNISVIDINQIFDGNKLYTISEEDKEVVITNAKNNPDDILTPTKILSVYEYGFKYEIDSRKTVNGKKLVFIKLTPTKDSALNYCLVGIEENTNTLYQYKELTKDGITTTLTVKDYLENLVIPKTFFTFDSNKFKSKGYYITEI